MGAEALPPARYIGSEFVMRVLAEHGRERIERLNSVRVLALGVLGGSFITTGALLAMLLAAGAQTEGALRLLEGFGFSIGFFFVILSGAVLFTETNVVLPAVLLRHRAPVVRVLRFWALAVIGNVAGAWVTGQAIAFAIELSPATQQLLTETVAAKTAAVGGGGVAWWSVVVSGVLANWLVGMAAFFATMGRTIIGKYVPVFLAVTAFVAAGFQHSPANMGFFSLESAFAGGMDWGDVLLWNLAPAGLGNVVGGGIAVALLLTWVYGGFSRSIPPLDADAQESGPTSASTLS
jgi:formate transporter